MDLDSSSLPSGNRTGRFPAFTECSLDPGYHPAS
jgi:hypothetical protein